MSAPTIRAFVAAELPSALRESIWEAFAPARQEQRDLRWVALSNLHLTVKFLGQVESARLDELGGAAGKACLLCRPFDVSLRGLGCFPPRGPARVLWIGVQNGRAELELLAAEVDRQLGKRGIARESRPFDAHLTLARRREGQGSGDLSALSFALGAREWGSFLLSGLSFMESRLRPEGPLYTRLAWLPLDGGQDSQEGAP